VDVDATPMPLYQARVVKPGDDLTLITYGPLVRTCVEAALAAAEEGRDIEVIDLRSLSPLDDATILESVQRTGRAVVVHEAAQTLGLGAEIAARLQQECFFSLHAPVLRVTGYDMPYPPSRVEAAYLPDLDRVLDAVDRSLAY
jgi:2-oxoisovalerate dehydrogenase E1 component beta subunit